MGERGWERGQGLSLLYQSVDVMLGAVLAVGHLKHARHTQQRLLGVPVCHHLEQHPKTKRKPGSRFLTEASHTFRGI